MERIKEYISHLQGVISVLPVDSIKRITELVLEAYQTEKQVFILGNGGSASTASHFACDLGKGTVCGNGRRFKAISLTDNVALMTAWANDSSYGDIFREQLRNLLNMGDIVIGISASGNSRNVINAVEYANSRDCVTIGLVGFGGGELSRMVDECIIVESDRYGPVEDVHLVLEHIISSCIAEELANESVLVGSGSGDKTEAADRHYSQVHAPR